MYKPKDYRITFLPSSQVLEDLSEILLVLHFQLFHCCPKIKNNEYKKFTCIILT